jgi:hypothetical protein
VNELACNRGEELRYSLHMAKGNNSHKKEVKKRKKEKPAAAPAAGRKR